MVLSLVSAVLGLAVTGQSGDSNFLNESKNRWALEGLRSLKSQGMLVGFPDGLSSREEWGRYRVAIAFFYAAKHLQTIEDQTLVEADKVACSADEVVKPQKLVADEEFLKDPLMLKNVRYLERAAAEFKHELFELGANSKDVLSPAEQVKANFAHFHFPKPGSALKPFSDVPPNHWAFAATTNLRASGVLHGYPDGTFKGD